MHLLGFHFRIKKKFQKIFLLLLDLNDFHCVYEVLRIIKF